MAVSRTMVLELITTAKLEADLLQPILIITIILRIVLPRESSTLKKFSTMSNNLLSRSLISSPLKMNNLRPIKMLLKQKPPQKISRKPSKVGSCNIPLNKNMEHITIDLSPYNCNGLVASVLPPLHSKIQLSSLQPSKRRSKNSMTSLK